MPPLLLAATHGALATLYELQLQIRRRRKPPGLESVCWTNMSLSHSSPHQRLNVVPDARGSTWLLEAREPSSPSVHARRPLSMSIPSAASLSRRLPRIKPQKRQCLCSRGDFSREIPDGGLARNVADMLLQVTSDAPILLSIAATSKNV